MLFRSQESIECGLAFGQAHPYVDAALAPVADVGDADEMLDIAENRGYFLWQFRPVRGGLWEEVTEDATLEPGGYRNPPCPEISRDFGDTRWLRMPRKTVFRFGRAAKFLLPFKSETAH